MKNIAKVFLILLFPFLIKAQDCSVCYGDSVQITTNISNGVEPVLYAWSCSNGEFYSDQNPWVHATGYNDIVCYLQIIDSVSCLAYDTINIDVWGQPTFSISESLCEIDTIPNQLVNQSCTYAIQKKVGGAGSWVADGSTLPYTATQGDSVRILATCDCETYESDAVYAATCSAISCVENFAVSCDFTGGTLTLDATGSSGTTILTDTLKWWVEDPSDGSIVGDTNFYTGPLSETLFSEYMASVTWYGPSPDQCVETGGGLHYLGVYSFSGSQGNTGDIEFLADGSSWGSSNNVTQRYEDIWSKQGVADYGPFQWVITQSSPLGNLTSSMILTPIGGGSVWANDCSDMNLVENIATPLYYDVGWKREIELDGCDEVILEGTCILSDCNVTMTATYTQGVDRITTSVTGCSTYESRIFTFYNSTIDQIVYQGTASLVLNPPAGSYIITVNCDGCIATASAVKTANCGAWADVSASGCLLTATKTNCATATWQWYFNGSVISGATSATYTATLNGNYYVLMTCTSDGNCTDPIASNSVFINSCEPICDPSVSIVENPECTLTAYVSNCDGTPSYSWSNGGSGQTISGLSGGTYTVTVTGCCSSLTASRTIASCVDPCENFNLSLSGGGTICSDESEFFSTFVSNGTIPYTFQWYVNNGLIGNTSSFFTFAGYPAGSYSVRALVADDNGCVASKTNFITVQNCVVPCNIAVNVSPNSTTLCEGESQTFTRTITGATGGTTTQWYINSIFQTSGTSFTHTFNTSGTFNVAGRVEDSEGCIDDEVVTVIVDSGCFCGNCNVSMSYDVGTCRLTWNQCPGWTVSLQYRPDGTSPFTIVSGASSPYYPTFNGEYRLSINTGVGCPTVVGSTTTVSCVVGCGNNVTATVNNATICNGGSANLTVTPSGGAVPYTYSWSTGSTSSTISVSPTTSSSYTVTVTDNDGCTAVASGSVTVNQGPTITPNTSACSQNLTTYYVEINTSGTVNTSHGSIANLGGGDYRISSIPSGQDVTITSTLNSCSSQYVYPAPNCSCDPISAPTNPQNALKCEGDPTAQISVSVPVGHTANWYTAATGGSLVASSSTTYTPPTQTAGMYTFYAESENVNSNCKSSTRTAVTLSVYDNPTVSVTDDNICEGASGTITATPSGGMGPYTYLWTTGSTNPSITRSPASTTSYTVTVTDANGCEGSSSGSITVLAEDVITITGSSCSVDLTTYTVTLTSGGTITSSVGTPTDLGYIGFGLNEWEITGIPVGQNVTITSTLNGCVINVIETSPNCSCPTVPAPTSAINKQKCEGEAALTLTVSSAGGYQVDWYTLSSGGTLVATNTTSYQPPTQTTGVYNYFVENYDNVSGCVSSRTPVSLTVFSTPIVTVSDFTICLGESQLITSSPTGNGPFTYSWSTGSTLGNITVSPTTSTNYTVTITDSNGCTDSDVSSITVNAVPTLVISSEDCSNDLLTYDLTITSNGSVTSNFGTPSDQGGGNWLVTGIPSGQTVQVTATLSGCTKVLNHNAPDCSCPTVPAPTNVNNVGICDNDPAADLTVTTQAGYYVDWYSLSSGGSLLATGVTTYTPPTQTAGVYTFYVENVDNVSGCKSIRVPISLIVYNLPAITFSPQTICLGDAVTLDATPSGSSPFSYGWSNGATSQDINVSPISTGSYTVTVTDSHGCEATHTETVTVNPYPTITTVISSCSVDLLTYNVTLTSNGTVTSDVGTPANLGGNSWEITGISTGTNLNISSTLSGCVEEYFFASPLCGCPVVPQPTSVVNKEKCSGEAAATLTVSTQAGYEVDWYSAATGGTKLADNITSYTPPTQTIGVYTFYVENVQTVNGCSSSRLPISLSVYSLPTIFFSAETICVGESVQLDATPTAGNPTYTYSWSNGATSQDITVSPNSTTNYTVTVTDANGCEGTHSEDVTVNPNPTISSATRTCSNDLLTYTATFTSNGSVTSNYGTATNTGGSNWEISGVSSGQAVTATATLNGCTTDRVFTAPDCNCPVVSPPSGLSEQICEGDPTETLTVSVQAGHEADWYSASSGGTLLADGSNTYQPPTQTAGTYTFYVESQNTTTGCTSSRVAISLTVNSLPSITFSAETICFGESILIDATPTGNSPFTYSWSTGAISQDITVSPSSTTGYTVTVTDVNGCQGTQSNNVTVNPLPYINSVTKTCSNDLLTYSIQLQSDGTITSNFGTPNNLAGIAWEINGISAGQNVIVTSTLNSCQRNLTVTAPNCSCPVVAVPTNVIDQEKCNGESSVSLAVSVQAGHEADWYSAASGGTLLQNGSNNYTPPTQTTGVYTFYVESQNTTTNCVSSRVPITLTVYSLPSITVTDETICFGQSSNITSTPTGSSPYTYLWTTGATGTNITVSPTTSTTYTLTLTDNNGCTDSDVSSITVNSNPTLSATDVDCTVGLDSFDVTVTTNGTLSANYGTVNGSVIESVPIANTVTITATLNGCTTDIVVVPPDCSCPYIPPPTSPNNPEKCSGDADETLMVSLGANQVADWYTVASGGTSVHTGASYTPSAQTSTTTYYVEATNTTNSCISSRIANTLTVNSNPAVTLIGETICDGENSTLVPSVFGGDANYTYLWSTTATTSSITVSPTLTTNYSVTVTDGNGCTDNDNDNVTVNDYPTYSNETITCDLDLTTYDVSFDTDATNVNYSYSGGAGSVSISQNGATWTVSNLPVGASLTVNYTKNGCTSQKSYSSPTCSCPNISDPSGTDQEICFGETTPSLTVTPIAAHTMNWYTNIGDVSSFYTGNSYTPSETAVGAYTYYVAATEDINSCEGGRIPITLTIYQNPTLTLNDATICDGSSALLAPSTSGGNGNYSYLWSTAATSSSINVSPSTTTGYSVTVTDGNGCTDNDNNTVTVNDYPTYSNETATCNTSLTTYNVTFDSDATTVNPSTGTASESGGTWTIPNITVGTNVNIDYEKNGCTSNVVVLSPTCPCPNVTEPIPSDEEICFGETTPALTVSANAGHTMNWYSAASGGTAFQTGNSYTPAVSAVGNYTYYVSAIEDVNSCESGRVSINLTINQNPTVTLANKTICIGETTLLTPSVSGGDGLYNYTWNTAATTATLSVSPSVNTNYSITVTDGNSCVDNDGNLVTVNQLPTYSNEVVTCDASLTTYTIEFDSDATTVNPSSGSASESLGTWTITGVSVGTSVSIDYSLNGCTESVSISSPSCPCPNITEPSGSNEVICFGEATPSLSVTPIAAHTINWYNNIGDVIPFTTGNSYTPSETAVGVYTYYITAVEDVNSCESDKVPIQLTIYQNPTVTLADNEICTGGNITINPSITGGDGVYSYLWNTGATIASINVSPASTAAYSLIVTDGKGCTDNDANTITVSPYPTYTTENITCDPSLSAWTLTFDSDASSVSRNYGTISNVGNSYTVTGIPVGQNVIITYSLGNCSLVRNVASPVCSCPLIQVPAVDDVEICLSQANPTFSATPIAGHTILWYNTIGGASINSGNTYTPNITTAGNYQYFARARNDINNCLSNYETINLIVNSNITLNVPNYTICDGESQVMQPNSLSGGDGNYSYLWSGGSTGTSYTVSPNTTTNYSLTVTDGTGCTASDNFSVTVNDIPTLEALGSADCSSSLLTYTVTFFSTANSVTTSAGTIQNAGSYWAIVGIPIGVTVDFTLNLSGCIRYESVASPSCPCPNVTEPTPNHQEICFGETTPSISVNNITDHTMYWYDGVGGTQIGTGLTYTPSETAIGSYSYWARAKENVNNCYSDYVEVTLDIWDNPTVAIPDGQVCSGSSTTIVSSVSGGDASYNYNWNTGATTSTLNVSPSSTTTYYLTVTDGNGCQDFDNATITVIPTPYLNTTGNSASCDIDLDNWRFAFWSNATTITATGGNPPFGASNFWAITNIPAGQDITITYSIDPSCPKTLVVLAPDCSCPTQTTPTGSNQSTCFGEATPSLSITPITDKTMNWYPTSISTTAFHTGNSYTSPETAVGSYTYYVRAVDNLNGCISDVKPITLTIYENPIVGDGSYSICAGDNVTLTAAPSGGTIPYSYSWSGGGTSSTKTVSPASTTAYTLTVTDDNGCTDTGTHTVTVVSSSADIVFSQPNNTTECNDAVFYVTGGNAPYDVLYTFDDTAGDNWELGVGNNQNITISAASFWLRGRYTTINVTVTDANGCEVTESFSINCPCECATSGTKFNDILSVNNDTQWLVDSASIRLSAPSPCAITSIDNYTVNYTSGETIDLTSTTYTYEDFSGTVVTSVLGQNFDKCVGGVENNETNTVQYTLSTPIGSRSCTVGGGGRICTEDPNKCEDCDVCPITNDQLEMSTYYYTEMGQFLSGESVSWGFSVPNAGANLIIRLAGVKILETGNVSNYNVCPMPGGCSGSVTRMAQYEGDVGHSFIVGTGDIGSTGSGTCPTSSGFDYLTKSGANYGQYPMSGTITLANKGPITIEVIPFDCGAEVAVYDFIFLCN